MQLVISLIQRGLLAGLALGAALAAPARALRATPASAPLAQPLGTARVQATGTFGTQATYSTDGYPAAVALADFNGDGRPDVVTANTLANTISVLLNTGTGTYPSSATTYATGGSPVAVATGDFNLDGNVDVVTANIVNDPTLKTGSISILLGSSSGTFTLSASYGSGVSSFYSAGQAAPTASTSSPVAVAVGLLSADAYPDVVITNADGGTVGVFINTGSGTFPSAATLYAVGSRPAGVAIGDFNLDSHPDLAVANSLSNTVSVLLNSGTGTFGTQAAYVVGSAPAAVAVGLLNSDSYPDIAVVNASDNTVSVVLNTGSGTFASSSPAYATDSTPSAVAVADLDVDGDVDIVTANGNAATASVLLNTGTGTYATKTDYATGSGPAGVAVGLLDTDTAPDLVLANSLGNSISVLLGTTSTLPVTLVSFTATAQQAAAVLRWTTASETNNKGFDVEASANGQTFQVLSFVAGAGTSTTSHGYTYTDAQLLAYGSTTVYYRLHQFDLDGTSTYSPVRSVAVPARATALAVYPNPAHLELTVTGPSAGTTIQLLNTLGQVLLKTEADASGATQLVLPASLPAGMYLLRSGLETQRVVVQ